MATKEGIKLLIDGTENAGKTSLISNIKEGLVMHSVVKYLIFVIIHITD